MRRKIEKYLARKQHCDESNIRYTDDGRFDFMGDLEGVLSAVRGKDSGGRGGARGVKKSGKKGEKPGKGAPPSSMGSMIPAPIVTSLPPGTKHHAAVYSSHGIPSHSGQQIQMIHHPSMRMAPPSLGHVATGKENIGSTANSNKSRGYVSADSKGNVSSKSSSSGNIFNFSPTRSAHKQSQRLGKTMALSDPHCSISSPNFAMMPTPTSAKSRVAFDTPTRSILKTKADATFHMVQSPAAMSMQGMTPLSIMKAALTPNTSSGAGLGLFSPSTIYGEDLNRTLFTDSSEDISGYAMKTPKKCDIPKMNLTGLHIYSVRTNKSSRKDDKLREVAISPIAQFSGSKRSIRRSFFSDVPIRCMNEDIGCKKSDALSKGSFQETPSTVCSGMTHTLTASMSARKPLTVKLLGRGTDGPLKMTVSEKTRTPINPDSEGIDGFAASAQRRRRKKSSLSILANQAMDSPQLKIVVSQDDSGISEPDGIEPSPSFAENIMDGLPTPGGSDNDKFWGNPGGEDLDFSPSALNFKSPLAGEKRSSMFSSSSEDLFGDDLFTKDCPSSTPKTSSVPIDAPSTKRRKTGKIEGLKQ